MSHEASDSLAGSSLSVGGAGVMAEAMIAGLLDRGLVSPRQIVASHPRQDRRDALTRKWGVAATASNEEAAAQSDLVFRTVKPQALSGVSAQLHGRLTPNQVAISVVAGA